MGSYRFQHRHGQSAPFATLEAVDDGDFFNVVLPAWEKRTGFRHIADTVTCAVSQYRKVPEPQTVGDAFFAHKREHPETVPYDQLTPIQKRMQSGGADGQQDTPIRGDAFGILGSEH